MKQIKDKTSDHPTKKQYELGHELVSVTAKSVTTTNNLILELAMSLFDSTGKYAVRQQADAVLWTQASGDFVESTPRNEYIFDMCVEFGGTVYTALVDSKNAIKKSAENTASSADFASFDEQIKAINERMKEAIKCLSGLVFLRNQGATNIKIQPSSKSVHKSIQCEMASGEYKVFNKTGIRAQAVKSVQSEAQRRQTAISDARGQALEFAIMKLMSVLVNDDRSVNRLADVSSAIEQSMLVELYQTLNLFMRDQESLIEKYSLENEAITKALDKSEPVAKEA